MKSGLIEFTTNEKGYPGYKIQTTLLRSALTDDTDEEDLEDIHVIMSKRVPFKCQLVKNERGIDSFSLIVD